MRSDYSTNQMKKVTFIELGFYEKISPLVSGYLQTYAQNDNTLRTSFSFGTYCRGIMSPREDILDELKKRDSDVYAFSCYQWNIRLVTFLVRNILRDKPEAYCILGGSQVERSGEDYLNIGQKNVFICNGEGEKTFANFLNELIKKNPDFTRIRGLSFCQGDQLIITDAEDRIIDLDSIPSPYLNNIISNEEYHIALLETIRGCPYSCGFCYKGNRDFTRTTKFDTERIRKEIEWISKKGFSELWIVDSNWGMFRRDLDLSNYIVACKKRYGAPLTVIFSAAKNHVERSVEIGERFQKAGINAPIVLALQSMTFKALKKVHRVNITRDMFAAVQETINNKQLKSHVEMIWPLPGETLSSFKRAINTLCELRASPFVYNLQLIKNTDLARKKREFGIVTAELLSQTSHTHLAVQTAEVSNIEYKEGMLLSQAMIVLYTLRHLYFIAYYLNRSKKVKYVDLFSSFTQFCKTYNNCPFIPSGNAAEVICDTLYTKRADFEKLILSYAISQPWWEDRYVQAFYELDLLNTPYILNGSPIQKKRYHFKYLDILETTPRSYIVKIPNKYLNYIQNIVGTNYQQEPGVSTVEIRHKQQECDIDLSHKQDDNQELFLLTSLLEIYPKWRLVDN